MRKRTLWIARNKYCVKAILKSKTHTTFRRAAHYFVLSSYLLLRYLSHFLAIMHNDASGFGMVAYSEVANKIVYIKVILSPESYLQMYSCSLLQPEQPLLYIVETAWYCNTTTHLSSRRRRYAAYK